MKKAVIGVAVVTAAAVTGYFVIMSSDEAPIRVRNGSMKVHAAEDQAEGKTWRWEAEDRDNDEATPNFSHEPNHFDPEIDDELWVKVLPGAGSSQCNQTIGSAEQVFIEYASQGDKVTVRFKRSRSGILNKRTKVRPQGSFTLADGDKTLQLAGTSFITEVRAGGLRCTFQNEEGLDTIYICSSQQRCQ